MPSSVSFMVFFFFFFFKSLISASVARSFWFSLFCLRLAYFLFVVLRHDKPLG